MAKVDQIEVEKYIQDIQSWIIDRVPESLIIKKIVDNGWGTKRFANKLIKEAVSRWTAMEEASLATRRKLAVVRLQLLARSLKKEWFGTPVGIKAILDIEKDINKLEGNYSPEKVEHGFDGNTLMDNNVNIIVTRTKSSS